MAALPILIGTAVVIIDRTRHRATAPVETGPNHEASRKAVGPAREGPSRMPELIAKLTDPAVHHSRHLESVRALPDDLSQAEFDELMAFIRGSLPEGFKLASWHVIVNEIMNELRSTRFKIGGYAYAMSGMVLDKSADPVVRDYAAQHLALCLDRVSHNPTETEFRFIMETFLKVLTGSDEAFHGVTGTILMSITAVSETFRTEDLAPYRVRLDPAIVALVSGDTPASLSNRISAIQAAGRLGVTQALPAIRDLARGSAPSPAIRLSAVAALGYFHHPEDRDFLKDIAANDNSLRTAAESALKNYPNL
jgi:hypothetical protein